MAHGARSNMHEWVEITRADEAYLTYICANCGKLGYAARECHSLGPTLDATRVAN